SNGICLLARPNHANPTVELAGRLEGGMLLEGDRPGLAHATASMLDRGTGRRSRGEIAEILEGLGASVSFRSTIEVVGFHAKCLREDLPVVVELLAEMLQQPAFPGKEWDIVRPQIVNAIREAHQETFDRAYHRAMEILCGDANPYARLTVGSEEALQQIKPVDLGRFHQQALAGRSMTVALVGDVEPEAGAALLERHLGDIDAGEPFPAVEEARRWTSFDGPSGVATEHVELPEKSQVDLVLARPGLSRLDPGYEAAFVANYVLGGHFSSRLNKELRDNEGLTYGTYSRLRPGLGVVPWYASIGVHPQNVERARTGMLREMDRLRAGGVAPGEFADAISHLTGSFPVRLEANRAVATMLLDGERYGQGPDVIESYLERLERIRRDDVEEQARRLFRTGGAVIVSAGSLDG
ncbi:MAG: hypothetical protein GF355_13980, partial [Candidatus Eisenbacteria bacterium]|nr:hypothetical protein [Candidatus Eisenbacteria bacterium]